MYFVRSLQMHRKRMIVSFKYKFMNYMDVFVHIAINIAVDYNILSPLTIAWEIETNSIFIAH